MNAQLNNSPSRICITVEVGGVFVYTSAEGLRRIAERLLSISKEVPSLHESLKICFEMGSPSSEDDSVWILLDQETFPIYGQGRDFEITFMAVEESDLDRLEQLRKVGKVPVGWRELDPEKVPEDWK